VGGLVEPGRHHLSQTYQKRRPLQVVVGPFACKHDKDLREGDDIVLGLSRLPVELLEGKLEGHSPGMMVFDESPLEYFRLSNREGRCSYFEKG
jgi:hypothetical protein